MTSRLRRATIESLEQRRLFAAQITASAVPTVTLTAPISGSSSTTAKPTFSGTASIATGDASTVSINLYAGSTINNYSFEVMTASVNQSTGTFSETDFFSLQPGVYTAQAVQTDAAGDTGYSAALTFTISGPTPTIASFVVDDGTAQRSIVRSATLHFTEPVYIDPEGAALTRSYNGSTQDMSLSVHGTYGGLGRLAYQYYFGADDGTSLPDGSYQFTFNLSDIHPADAPTTSLGTGQTTYKFFRLFGDTNGDGTVNLIDYRAFSSTYLHSTGDPGFNALFDSNSDGTVNLNDYRAFAANYLKSITA